MKRDNHAFHKPEVWVVFWFVRVRVAASKRLMRLDGYCSDMGVDFAPRGGR